MRRPALILVTLALVSAAPAVAKEAPVLHRSAGLGLRFAVPAACDAQEERHEPRDPTARIAHAVSVACGGPALLRIDMWQDPGERGVAAWVAARLEPLTRGADAVVSERLSALDVPAVRIERGHTPQTAPRRLVALKLEDRVYLISLEHADGPTSATLLETILGTLGPVDGGP